MKSVGQYLKTAAKDIPHFEGDIFTFIGENIYLFVGLLIGVIAAIAMRKTLKNTA